MTRYFFFSQGLVQKFIETSVTFVFHNSSENEIEGELQFPLEEGNQMNWIFCKKKFIGAIVCGYAVDIAGVMVIFNL